jgi:hypothetical protein
MAHSNVDDVSEEEGITQAYPGKPSLKAGVTI